LTTKPSIDFTGTDFDSQITLRVLKTTTYQTVLGFGGAFTEAAAYVFSQMNSTAQQEILNAYFGPNGNKYSVCRTHINSCDFSLASFSFDDMVDDFSLSNFTIAHSTKWMIPFILAAIKTSSIPIKIYGSPWSPPAWMKGNGQMDGSSSPGLKPDPRVHQAWALFFSKFLTAYKNLGINLWGITIQNEPEFAAPWEACTYTAEEQRDFLKTYLGPQMAKDHPNVTIMIWDHNKDHVVNWVRTIFSDPDAAKYAQGTAVHWYTGSQFENLATAHDLHPDKFILATEACNCGTPQIGNWPRGESYGYDIIGDLQNWAVGWVDWNMILNTQGGPNHLNDACDAPIIADPRTQQVYLNTPYYYMGQITRYVPPGSIRIGTQINGNNLSVVGFRTPDNSISIVVMNNGDSDQTFKLQDGTKYAKIDSPQHSIKTLVYSG